MEERARLAPFGSIQLLVVINGLLLPAYLVTLCVSLREGIFSAKVF